MGVRYAIYNGPMPTTAALAPVPTGTALKTMLQVKPGTQNHLTVIEWGISFDGNSAGTPIKCELIQTDVAATVTACVANDIVKFDDPNAIDPTTSNIILTTTGTGYSASGEGTPTATRLFDYQLVAPTSYYFKQFPMGREPQVDVSKFLRIRVTTATSFNAICYVVVEV